MTIVYLSSFLPKRSETFVYREVLGLRDRGVNVPTASLYSPDHDLGDPRLDEMAEKTIPVYGSGLPGLVGDAIRFLLRHPVNGGRTLALAARDLFLGSDGSFSTRWKVPIQALAGLALAARTEPLRPDAIHVHMAHAASTVGMYAAMALRVPFSFTGHAADLFRERALLREKLERARFTACISHWHRIFYQQILSKPDSDLPIIRCGVDVPGELPPRNIGTTFAVVSLGRMVPKKGFATVVQAVRILGDEIPGLHAVLAGDGPETGRLHTLAKGLPVAFPGTVDHCDVPALLATADVFVLPCEVSPDGDRDGIPVVLMEAMARGICVVAGDLPPIRELVQDGKTGILIPPGDAEALANAIRLLARNPEIRLTLGVAARKWVQEEFSTNGNLDRLQKALCMNRC